MASPFTRADVQAIAALAQLELTDREQDVFTRQLGDILQYAAEIQTFDTTGVPPTAAIAGAETDRVDALRPSLPRDETLANAPDPAPAGFFKVPRVIG